MNPMLLPSARLAQKPLLVAVVKTDVRILMMNVFLLKSILLVLLEQRREVAIQFMLQVLLMDFVRSSTIATNVTDCRSAGI